jgi:periplasmic divalent cation tolerance protein
MPERVEQGGIEDKVWVVLVTAPGEIAEELARNLVESRLAACVNVISGATSVYRWKGTLHADRESLLMAKVPAPSFPAFRDAVRRLHPYEVPEILALPVEAGLTEYLDWVQASCLGPGED